MRVLPQILTSLREVYVCWFIVQLKDRKWICVICVPPRWAGTVLKVVLIFSLLDYLVFKQTCRHHTVEKMEGHWRPRPGSPRGRAQGSDPALPSPMLMVFLGVNFCPAQLPWLFLEPRSSWKPTQHPQLEQTPPPLLCHVLLPWDIHSGAPILWPGKS